MKLGSLNIVLFVLALIIPVALGAVPRVSASEALEKVADNIGGAPSVKCHFILTDGQASSKGTLVISKDCFQISTDGYQIWYDGKTQWSLDESEKEVTVSEPTPAELEQVNPFAVLGSFRRAYDASYAKVSVPGSTTILLKAKSTKAQISSVEMTINSKTYVPTKIVISSDGNRKTTITVSSVVKGEKLPGATFKFDSGKYPGVEVNDMR